MQEEHCIETSEQGHMTNPKDMLTSSGQERLPKQLETIFEYENVEENELKWSLDIVQVRALCKHLHDLDLYPGYLNPNSF